MTPRPGFAAFCLLDHRHTDDCPSGPEQTEQVLVNVADLRTRVSKAIAAQVLGLAGPDVKAREFRLACDLAASVVLHCIQADVAAIPEPEWEPTDEQVQQGRRVFTSTSDFGVRGYLKALHREGLL